MVDHMHSMMAEAIALGGGEIQPLTDLIKMPLIEPIIGNMEAMKAGARLRLATTCMSWVELLWAAMRTTVLWMPGIASGAVRTCWSLMARVGPHQRGKVQP